MAIIYMWKTRQTKCLLILPAFEGPEVILYVKYVSILWYYTVFKNFVKNHLSTKSFSESTSIFSRYKLVSVFTDILILTWTEIVTYIFEKSKI